MSKKYKDKDCVYCAQPGASTSADHVLPRELFPIAKRGDLPKVPACASCNSAKSALELYAAIVMPFGATHAEARSVLETMVPPRLARHPKLAHELAAQRETRYVSSEGGSSWDVQMRLPFDADKVTRLFGMIVRGLAFWHWQLVLPDEKYIIRADYLNEAGRKLYDPLFESGCNKTGLVDLGEGIFIYEGVQSRNLPTFTLWRMSLLGSRLSGDPQDPAEIVSSAYGLTIQRSHEAAAMFVKLLDRAGSP